MSVMRVGLPRGNSYSIRTQHCATIIEANCPPGQNLGGDGECCFFCDLPDLNEKCERVPVLCGQTVEPSSGYCLYIVTTTVYFGTVEYTFPNGTHTISGDLFSVSEARIECYSYSLGGSEGSEAAGSPAGPGPRLLVRSAFPEGAAGVVPISGVARDDDWGIASLDFWVDGQPITLSGLQTGLPDPWTCAEIRAPNCRANSRFTGYLDTRNLADGPHTLQVVAVNGRPSDPIPSWHEVTFIVDNSPSCGDTTPPTVALTAPGTGATVSGTVTVTATASDPSGIERVAFYMDGAWKADDTTPPWSYSWDTSAAGDGAHELGARADDGCGNVRFATAVPVTVDNRPPVVATFTPTDDSFANQDNPSNPHGTAQNLVVRTSGGGHGRHAYLRFAVTGVTGPVVSARLRLRTQYNDLTEPTSLYRLLTTGWTEGALTWQNAPLDVAWSKSLPVPLVRGSWHEVDVTGAVTGNGVYTFALATSGDQPGWAFWSKESVHRPVLEVSYRP